MKRTNALVILTGNGDGTFAQPIYYSSFETTDLALGDFDRNGRTDVALTSYISQNAVSIFLNRSDCPFMAASILGIFPNTGSTGGGQNVNISGVNLSGATSVTFGGATAVITGNTATSISMATPAHTAGAVDVVVQVSAGSATSTGGYTYGAAVVPTPTGFTAGVVTTTRVDASWVPVGGASSYQIDRKAPGGGFLPLGTAATNSFSDTTAMPDTAYLYRVRAVSGAAVSGNSNPDLATTVIFTDSPLLGVTVKAIHLSESRGSVSAVRSLASLPATIFTDIAAAGTMIKDAHITELRTALDAALTELGFMTGSYTDPSLGGVLIKAVHFEELRSRVQ